MGTAVSYMFPNTGRTNDPDPVTGLTSREKYLVKTSWARVMKTPTDNGVSLLLLLFQKFPDYQQLFPFKDLAFDDLKDSPRFKAHASSVVHALDSVIASLNDNEVLITILKKIGSTHIKRNVTQTHFEHLKEVTVELFSQIMKPVEVEAWKKTLDVAWAQIYEGLKETGQ